MKNTITFITFLLSALFVHSQGVHVEPGLKVGLNVTTIYDESSESSEELIGLHLGGLAHIHLTRHIAIQPELLFSTQGGEQDFQYIIYQTYLNYINVPVLFQYMFNKGLRLETGPQLGVLLSAKEKYGSVTKNIMPSCQRYEFGWVAGISYLSHHGWGLDARYNFGLSSIYLPSYTEQLNRVAQVGVFYQFIKREHKL
jgi:hypothetical protein